MPPISLLPFILRARLPLHMTPFDHRPLTGDSTQDESGDSTLCRQWSQHSHLARACRRRSGALQARRAFLSWQQRARLLATVHLLCHDDHGKAKHELHLDLDGAIPCVSVTCAPSQLQARAAATTNSAQKGGALAGGRGAGMVRVAWTDETYEMLA